MNKPACLWTAAQAFQERMKMAILQEFTITTIFWRELSALLKSWGSIVKFASVKSEGNPFLTSKKTLVQHLTDL